MPTPQEFHISCGVGVGARAVFSLFIITYLLALSVIGAAGWFSSMIIPTIPKTFAAIASTPIADIFFPLKHYSSHNSKPTKYYRILIQNQFLILLGYFIDIY